MHSPPVAAPHSEPRAGHVVRRVARARGRDRRAGHAPRWASSLQCAADCVRSEGVVGGLHSFDGDGACVPYKEVRPQEI